jgi:hypothetical protein
MMITGLAIVIISAILIIPTTTPVAQAALEDAGCEGRVSINHPGSPQCGEGGSDYCGTAGACGGGNTPDNQAAGFGGHTNTAEEGVQLIVYSA